MLSLARSEPGNSSALAVGGDEAGYEDGSGSGGGTTALVEYEGAEGGGDQYYGYVNNNYGDGGADKVQEHNYHNYNYETGGDTGHQDKTLDIIDALNGETQKEMLLKRLEDPSEYIINKLSGDGAIDVLGGDRYKKHFLDVMSDPSGYIVDKLSGGPDTMVLGRLLRMRHGIGGGRYLY